MAQPMTIGIDGRFLQDKFHGIGRYTFGLLQGLCALDGEHRITLFYDPALPNQRFPLEQLTGTGRLRLEPIAVPLYSPSELWLWPPILRRSPVDLFHSPYFWSPMGLRCPLVTTVHDMIFDRYPAYIPGRRFWLPYLFMSRYALWRSQYVIAVSEATRRDITQYAGTPPRKIVTILEGVEERFRPVREADELARVRERYGLPERFVLALGARRPHKNIKRLVGAFSRIAAEVPQALVLVGTVDRRFSDDASDPIGELRRTGRVIEIDAVDDGDLSALFSLADLFVQPSIIEGFGLPLLEAMACGCPTACSNTSSLPEVAGDAALLFDPLSEDAMAAIMLQALHSPELRAGLVERGFERARQLNWQAAAAQTLALYERSYTEAARRPRLASARGARSS